MKKEEEARLRAAEEVCYNVLLMMALGGLPIPYVWRPMLAEPMERWASLASEQGLLSEWAEPKENKVADGQPD